MNPQIFNIIFEEGMDTEAIIHLKNNLAFFEDNIEFHQTPAQGIQVSAILVMMTSIAFIFGASFVKKLGDRTAEDCYPIIKKSLETVYKKYFGKNPEYRYQIITSRNSSKKVPDSDYSLVLALYCVSKNNERVKFLYKTSWGKKQFDAVTEIYLSSIIEFVNTDSGAVRDLLDEKPTSLPPSLIAWDEFTGTLTKLSPLLKDIS
tara:strand:+ start:345 stop:956 length:612 start_codon:yes stop_codon:yes gene_type:complete